MPTIIGTRRNANDRKHGRAEGDMEVVGGSSAAENQSIASGVITQQIAVTRTLFTMESVTLP